MKFGLSYLLADAKSRPATTRSSGFASLTAQFTLVFSLGVMTASDDSTVGERVSMVVLFTLLTALTLGATLIATNSDAYLRRSDEYVLLLGYGMTERGLFALNLLRDTILFVAGVPISLGLGALAVKLHFALEHAQIRAEEWYDALNEYYGVTFDEGRIPPVTLLCLGILLLTLLVADLAAHRRGMRLVRAKFKSLPLYTRREVNERVGKITSLKSYMRVSRSRLRASTRAASLTIAVMLVLPLIFGVAYIYESVSLPRYGYDTFFYDGYDLFLERGSRYPFTEENLAEILAVEGVEIARRNDNCTFYLKFTNENWYDSAAEVIEIVKRQNYERFMAFALDRGAEFRLKRVSLRMTDIGDASNRRFFGSLALILFAGVALGQSFVVGGYLESRREETRVLARLGVARRELTRALRRELSRLLLLADETAIILAGVFYVILDALGGGGLGAKNIIALLILAALSTLIAPITAKILTKSEADG